MDSEAGPDRSRVLQGSLVLLGVLVLGPFVSWKLLLLLWPARWTLLATWVAAEACFYWVYYRPAYARHNRIPQPCRPKGFTDAEGQRQWRRFMAVTKALPGRVDAKEYLQQWFCDAPLEVIRQENVREMLTYGFFYKTREELSPELDAFTHQMVKELGESLHISFEPGYTPCLTQHPKPRSQRPRSSSGLEFMDHLWDDLRAQPRPLVKYLFFEGLYFAQRMIMAGYGFQHRRLGQLGYYTLGCGLDAEAYSRRKQTSGSSDGCSGSNDGSSSGTSLSSRLDHWLDWLLDWLRPADSAAAAAAAAAGGGGGVQRVGSAVSADSDDYTPFADPMAVEEADHPPAAHNPLSGALGQDRSTPVLFLHGVGGLMLYLELLKHVIGLGHPMVVVEYKHVGLRLSSAIPDVDTLTRNVVDILDFEGIRKVCVVGHSYGSFLASRLNMCYKERVHSLCVIDPVALGMFMPHLLHNFMYRSPRVNLRRPDILARDLVLAFASRDVHLAAAFQRNFYWTEMNMWPQDLPSGSCVILSEDDDLCDAEGVEEMCRLAPHVKVIRNNNLFHGAFLFSTTHKASFVAEVRNLLATSGSLVVHMARPVLEKTITATRSLLQGVETLTSRLSMSPSPYGAGGGLEQRPSIWRTMSSFKGRKRSSVPIPDPHSNASSTSTTPMPPRSDSAPLHDTTAAAAVAAGGGSPPAAAAAAAAAATPAGWWGAAATAAAAQCDQQPGAAGVQGLRGQQQQPKQLSMILSGPEGTLASELGQAPGGSGGSSRLGGSSSTAADILVEDDWVITDQNNGAAAAGGSGSGEGLGLLGSPLSQGGGGGGVYRNVLGAIQEDASEQQQQQREQREPPLPNKSSAAAAAAAAAAPAGSADAVAVDDQTA